MGDTKIEFLDAAKLLLGIDDDGSDALLSFLIDDTIEAVLSYCRLDVLPRQLEGFIPTLVADRFTNVGTGGVKSVTEGERRVEYRDSKTNFLSKHITRLRPFISRAVTVPSDLDKGDTKDEQSV